MNHEADWKDCQVEGAALYTAIQSGAGRLEAAIDLVKQLEKQPLEAKKYLGNMLLLIEAARSRPELHETILRLLGLLELWTGYMDDWRRWEAVLWFGVRLAEQFNLPEQQVRFLNSLSAILMNTGRTREACNIVEQGLRIARQTSAAIPLATMVGNAVEILLFQQTAEDLLKVLAEIKTAPCIQAASGKEAAEVDAYLYFAHARLARQTGNLDTAFSYADRAVRCLETYPDINPHLKPEVYRLRGLYSWVAGKPEAVYDLKRAARLAAQQGNEFTRAIALANLGLHYRNTGKLDRAEYVTDKAISTAKRLHAIWLATREIGNLALVSLFQGRLKEAERLVKRHLKLSVHLGIESEVGRAKGNLGVIKLHLGEYDASYHFLEFGRKATEKLGKLEGMAVIYANLCRCCVSLGRIEEAQRLGKDAVRFSQQIQSIPLQIMSLRALAEAVSLQPARHLLYTAYSLSKGRRFDRAACLIALAGLESNPARRLKFWQCGSQQLIEMGAGAWLQDYSVDYLPRLPALV